jgi:DNA-binding transcriptional LysR family regulator
MAYYGQICAVLDSLSRRPVHHGRLLHAEGQTEDRHAHVLQADPAQPPICEFQRRYPEIGIEVILSDAYMDLVDQGLDDPGAGTLEDSTLRAKPCARCSGALRRPRLPEGGGPARPPDGSQAPQLPALQPLLLPQQVVLHPGRGSVAVELPPASFCANNGIALKQAAVQGSG